MIPNSRGSMFQEGDLVKVRKLNDGREYLNRYLNREFTIINVTTGECMCIRGGMTHTRWFFDSEIELVENIPKYSMGALVEDKRYNGYIGKFPLGIVEHSNRLGSIVRFNIRLDCGEHCSTYISNRNLRRIK